MAMKEYEHLVGIIDGDPDFISLLDCFLSEEGFGIVSEQLSEISQDQEKYLEILRRKPAVLVVNVDHPIEKNLQKIQALLSLPESSGIGVIYTSASKKAVDNLLGSDVTIGLPFESCDQLPRAIRQMIAK